MYLPTIPFLPVVKGECCQIQFLSLIISQFFFIWAMQVSYLNSIFALYPETDLILQHYPKAIIKETLRGLDIGGFLATFQMSLDAKKEYDFIFKIHTKTDDGWRHHLLIK